MTSACSTCPLAWQAGSCGCLRAVRRQLLHVAGSPPVPLLNHLVSFVCYADDEADGNIEVLFDSQGQDGSSGDDDEGAAAADPTASAGGMQAGRPPQAAAPAARAAPPRRVSFQPPPVADGGGAATPAAAAGPRDDGDGSDAGTPYDGVLAMLRQGPLAAASPRSFPRPRPASQLTAGAGRTPGPGLAFVASPSPAAGASGGSRLGAPPSGGSTPSTGVRTGFAPRSASRFARTPVHMQPLAAGGGRAAPAATSRFGLAAAASAGAAANGGGGGAAPLLSPAPLAWTPMRSNVAGGARGAAVVAGAKRKADTASPDAGGLGASFLPALPSTAGTSRCLPLPPSPWLLIPVALCFQPLCRCGRYHQLAGRPAAHPPAVGAGRRRHPRRRRRARLERGAHALPPARRGPVTLRRPAAAAAAAAAAGEEERPGWPLGAWAGGERGQPAAAGRCGVCWGAALHALLARQHRPTRASRLPMLRKSLQGCWLRCASAESAAPLICSRLAFDNIADQQPAGPPHPPTLPAGLLAGAPVPPPPLGGKATTDTARRILATLEALDQAVAAGRGGGDAAAVAAALAEGEEAAAPSPPPTDSLGFAGGGVGGGGGGRGVAEEGRGLHVPKASGGGLLVDVTRPSMPWRTAAHHSY
jgi:hypothetical protein